MKTLTLKYKADFSPLKKAVYADITASNGLQEAIHDFWPKTKYTDPLQYRRDFVAWYISLGVSTSPEAGKAYANRIAAEAGFRLRAAGAGRKPAAKKTPFEVWLQRMPKKLTNKERKTLLAMI